MRRDSIFISYTRDDSNSRDRLVKHLEAILGPSPSIPIFADTKIEPGEQWRLRIYKEMDRALVVVLLVSTNFLTSEFVRSVEIPRAALRPGSEVLVVDADSRLRRRRVTVLRAEGERVWIAEGLAEGERVCATPPPVVVEGMSVRVVSEEGSAAS